MQPTLKAFAIKKDYIYESIKHIANDYIWFANKSVDDLIQIFN